MYIVLIDREEHENRLSTYRSKWLSYEKEYEKHPKAKEIRKYKLESAELEAQGSVWVLVSKYLRVLVSKYLIRGLVSKYLRVLVSMYQNKVSALAIGAKKNFL